MSTAGGVLPIDGTSTITAPYTFTINVPNGVFSGWTWTLTLDASSTAGTETLTTASPASNAVSFTARGGAGAATETVAASAAMLAEINAAAGSTLTVTLSSTAGTCAFSPTKLTATYTPCSSGSGSPGPCQAIVHADTLATFAKTIAPYLGQGASTETTRAEQLLKNVTTAVIGNPATGAAGIGHPDLQATLKTALIAAQSSVNRAVLFGQMMRPQIQAWANQIVGNLPKWTDATTGAITGWSFAGGSPVVHPLDAYLQRLNALGTNVPAAGSAGTLTATTVNAGALNTCTSGNGVRVVFTHVGSTNSVAVDYYESLPTAEATQVALANGQNAYTFAIAGTVPSGVYKVRVYRGLESGASGGPYFFDQDVACTPGASYPSITISQGDKNLRQDWTPPGWGSALMTPEFAEMFASSMCGFKNGQPVMSAVGMLTPTNVHLPASNGNMLGYGNVAQSAIFGSEAITGATAGTFTAGSIQTVNSPASNVQGYVGATRLRARVTTALNGAGTFKVVYSYYDAAHGWGSAQSATSNSTTFGATTVGTTIDIYIPAGRIVYAATAVNTLSGFSSSGGAFIIEAKPIRNY